MAKTTTKKVRLGAERARRLKALAEDSGTTESEILRYGIDLVDRIRARRANVEDLIALANGPEPPKVPFELHP